MTKSNETETFYYPELPPTSNNQWRHGRSWQGKPVTYLTQQAREWREDFAYEALKFFKKHKVKMAPASKPVSLKIVVAVIRIRDVDATLKIILDALQGVLYENDSQVEYVELYRYITTDGTKGVFITVFKERMV